MTGRGATALLLMVLLATGLRADDAAAQELVRRVAAAREIGSVMVRARLVVTDTAEAGRPRVLQLRMRARRDGATTRCLWQVLWPAEEQGRALCFERADDGVVTGFLFAPPEEVTPLTPELMAGSFLGSDLSIEDLAGDFWSWPEQAILGEEVVDGEACTIVESRPPGAGASGYAAVRSWISPTRLLPLRIEKFDATGGLVKRFAFSRLARRDGVWTPAVTVVRRPDGTRETLLEISRGDREADVPLETFSLEEIRKLVPSGAAPGTGEAEPAHRGPPGRR